MERIKIGLVGFGTVGSSFYRLIQENGDRFADRLGVAVTIGKIADIDVDKVRAAAAGQMVVDDYRQIVEDPEIPILVELVGGVGIAYEIIKSALRRHKHVITANKALLALHGDELFKLARVEGVKLKFEASVCGGIPIIKVIRESLIGNRIRKITGIVNGTSNYILTRMSEDALTFEQALKLAQELGFAEADPTLDVSGGDSAHKISLLAGFSFGQWIDYRQILCEGITSITPQEIGFVDSAGFVFKLIAQAELIDGKAAVAVFPALVPGDHPLASVREEMNGVLMEADFLGPSMYEGRGAGGDATASSVASDLGDLVQRLILKTRSDVARIETSRASELFPVQEMRFPYFFHFVTENRPGIWATVTGKLADHGINIESVHQEWEDRAKPSHLFVLVDAAAEKQAQSALEEIRSAPGISPDSRFYRILKK